MHPLVPLAGFTITGRCEVPRRCVHVAHEDVAAHALANRLRAVVVALRVVPRVRAQLGRGRVEEPLGFRRPWLGPRHEASQES